MPLKVSSIIPNLRKGMQWNDSVNFLSKLSVKRATNAILLLISFFISKITKKAWNPALPLAISIEPTTSCNLRCPECPSGLRAFTRPIGMLENPLFKNVIDQLESHLLYLIFYFQGEPYLNPSFLEMVSYAVSKKIYTATSTNGHYLNDNNARQTVVSGLDRLIVSIDGTTQEVYETYRKGGNLSKVIEGVRNVVAWKKKLKSSTPHVVLQFLVMRPNEHQTEEVIALSKSLEADELVFKTVQIYEHENGSELIPSQEKYSRYKKDSNGKYSIKNKLLNECWKMWHSCVITWDGKVVPCCFDKDATFQLGSLKQTPFKEIWRSNKYIKFRSSLLKSRKEIEICKNCTEGTKVLERF